MRIGSLVSHALCRTGRQIVVLLLALCWCSGAGWEAQPASVAAPSVGAVLDEVVDRPVYGQSPSATRDWMQSRPDARASDAVRTRYGERGLKNLFGGAETLDDLSRRVPGVSDTARLTASTNANVRKGAMRELLYASQFDRSRAFESSELRQLYRFAQGVSPTDKDIVLRHLGTGREVWVESKDVRGLRLDRRTQKQLDRMGEAVRRGEPAFVLNRQSVSPSYRRYAEARGVPVYDHARSRELPIRDMDMEVRRQVRRRVTGVGIAVTAMETWRLARGWDEQRGVERGQSFGRISMGLGVTASGAGSMLSAGARADRFLRVGGSMLIGVGVALEAGSLGYGWYSGELSGAEMGRRGITAAGGLAGAWGGSWAGAGIGAGVGSFIPLVGTSIGGAVGGVIGGLAGYWGGAELSGSVAERLLPTPGADLSPVGQDALLIYLAQVYGE